MDRNSLTLRILELARGTIMINSNDRHKNWSESIDPRIEELERRGFYLEAFYFYSATIEFQLQEAVEFQEMWMSHLAKKSKMSFVPTPVKTLQEQPLGTLIKIFARYCDDAELVSQLNEFNSFRKTITHRLLSNSVKSLNNMARTKRTKYYELVVKLSKYNLFLIRKKTSSNKRKKLARDPIESKSESS